jgi:cytidylate kinase
VKNIIIAIDGFSSTGKSTIAKQLAKALEYVYVDSGAMYRAVTLYTLQKGYISKDHFNKAALIKALGDIKLTFEFNPSLEFSEMYLNGKNVESDIRSMQVSNFVSPVSEVPAVRHQLVLQQQDIGKGKGIVMDGRDIGTVVFPKAELKFFITASEEIRARRRYNELIERQIDVSYDEVLKNVTQRDYIDSHRKDSPLIKADDAIEIDNSKLSPNAQFQKILKLAKHTLQKLN